MKPKKFLDFPYSSIPAPPLGNKPECLTNLFVIPLSLRELVVQLDITTTAAKHKKQHQSDEEYRYDFGAATRKLVSSPMQASERE